MKKTIITLLSLCLVASLIGCSKSNTSGETAPVEDTASETAAEETVEETVKLEIVDSGAEISSLDDIEVAEFSEEAIALREEIEAHYINDLGASAESLAPIEDKGNGKYVLRTLENEYTIYRPDGFSDDSAYGFEYDADGSEAEIKPFGRLTFYGDTVNDSYTVAICTSYRRTFYSACQVGNTEDNEISKDSLKPYTTDIETVEISGTTFDIKTDIESKSFAFISDEKDNLLISFHCNSNEPNLEEVKLLAEKILTGK